MKAYFVYMMTNRSWVVLDPGVTNSLQRRLWYHGNNETYYDVRDAIARKKEIKKWRREKKNDLMRRLNPKWEDLGKKLFFDRR